MVTAISIDNIFLRRKGPVSRWINGSRDPAKTRRCHALWYKRRRYYVAKPTANDLVTKLALRCLWYRLFPYFVMKQFESGSWRMDIEASAYFVMKQIWISMEGFAHFVGLSPLQVLSLSSPLPLSSQCCARAGGCSCCFQSIQNSNRFLPSGGFSVGFPPFRFPLQVKQFSFFVLKHSPLQEWHTRTNPDIFGRLMNQVRSKLLSPIVNYQNSFAFIKSKRVSMFNKLVGSQSPGCGLFFRSFCVLKPKCGALPGQNATKAPFAVEIV